MSKVWIKKFNLNFLTLPGSPKLKYHFHFKVIRAEDAGAVAVIVTDQDHDNDELFISMVDDTTEREVSIPAAFVLGKNG